MLAIIVSYKNSLKIQTRKSISVNRRRTNNAMAKGKSTKGQQRSTKHTHTTKDRITRTRLSDIHRFPHIV